MFSKLIPEKLRSHEYFWPLVLTLIAFLIRLVYLLEIKEITFLDQLSLDPGFYNRWGARIAAGQLISERAFFAAPLYAYLLGLIYAIAGHSLFFVRFLQVVFGSVNLLLIYFLAQHYFSKRVGFLASLFYLFYGIFYFYEGLILKTSVGIFFNLVFLCFLVRYERQAKIKNLFFAGISFGLAASIRGNVLLLLPFLYPYLYLIRPPDWLKSGAVFTFGIILVISPFTFHNYLVSKDFILINSNGGVNFYIGNNPKANGTFISPPGIRANMEYEEIDYLKVTRQLTGKTLSPSKLSRYWFNLGLKFLRENSQKIPKLYLRKVRLFWNHLELADNQDFYFYRALSVTLKVLPLRFGFIASLGLTGLLFFYREWRRLLLLYLFIIIYFLSVIPFFIFARYRLGLLPLLIIFAAALVDRIYATIVQGELKQLLNVAGVLVLSLTLVYWPLPGMKSAHTIALSYYKFGNYLYREKKFDQSVKYLNKALEYFPAYPGVYNRLGIISLNRNQFSNAAKHFQKAVEIDPGFLEALSNYAQVMERIDKEKAVELWQKYLAKAQNDPQEQKYVLFAQERLKKLKN